MYESERKEQERNRGDAESRTMASSWNKSGRSELSRQRDICVQQRNSENGSRPRRCGDRQQEGRGLGAPRERSFSRPMTLAIAAREYVWLWDNRHGVSVKTIAARGGLSDRSVQLGIARARAQEQSHTSTRSLRPP